MRPERRLICEDDVPMRDGLGSPPTGVLIPQVATGIELATG